MKIRGELRQLVKEIEANGYTVEFPDYCEDTRTPGVLGYYGGVTDRNRRQVKISRRANRTREQMAITLKHELRHVTDPSWDCGNRPIGLGKSDA